MRSAKQSMGRITPVEGFAPKAIAMSGMEIVFMPCMPVFDIPMSTAHRKSVHIWAGDENNCEKSNIIGQ